MQLTLFNGTKHNSMQLNPTSCNSRNLSERPKTSLLKPEQQVNMKDIKGWNLVEILDGREGGKTKPGPLSWPPESFKGQIRIQVLSFCKLHWHGTLQCIFWLCFGPKLWIGSQEDFCRSIQRDSIQTFGSNLVEPAAAWHDDPDHALRHPRLAGQHRRCQDLLHSHLPWQFDAILSQKETSFTLTCWQSFGTLSAHFWWNLNPQVRQQKPDKNHLKSWPLHDLSLRRKNLTHPGRGAFGSIRRRRGRKKFSAPAIVLNSCLLYLKN